LHKQRRIGCLGKSRIYHGAARKTNLRHRVRAAGEETRLSPRKKPVTFPLFCYLEF
jgi:hypothetical protein